MPPHVKAAFLTNLRSGRYKQIRRIYVDPENRSCACALGVLLLTLNEPLVQVGASMMPVHWTDVLRKTSLTLEQCMTIIHLNDRDELTFAQIADYVEEKF